MMMRPKHSVSVENYWNIYSLGTITFNLNTSTVIELQ